MSDILYVVVFGRQLLYVRGAVFGIPELELLLIFPLCLYDRVDLLMTVGINQSSDLGDRLKYEITLQRRKLRIQCK